MGMHTHRYILQVFHYSGRREQSSLSFESHCILSVFLFIGKQNSASCKYLNSTVDWGGFREKYPPVQKITNDCDRKKNRPVGTKSCREITEPGGAE